jgi:hypothetical protein
MCEAQPQLSEAVGSFVDRRANWLNAGPRDYVEWRETHRRGHVRS